MSQTNYVQRGESLDYPNRTDKTIHAGDVVPMVTRIGVAGTDILPGETGSIHVCGVFKIAKTGNTAIPMGTAVFFDGTGITDQKETAREGGTDPADVNIPAGYTAAAAEEDDASVTVKLLG